METLLTINTGEEPIAAVTLTPKSDGLVSLDIAGHVSHWSVVNPHPEVTWRSLFGKVWYFIDHPGFPIPAKLSRMFDIATMMVRGAIDSFVHLDAKAARRICGLDDEVDHYNREIIEELYQVMRWTPDLIPAAMHCFSASRHVERIADHATNIAEDVIYLVEGEIARHKHNGVHLPRE